MQCLFYPCAIFYSYQCFSSYFPNSSIPNYMKEYIFIINNTWVIIVSSVSSERWLGHGAVTSWMRLVPQWKMPSELNVTFMYTDGSVWGLIPCLTAQIIIHVKSSKMCK